MIDLFNALPWHDSEILEIKIDRSNPGKMDTVFLGVRWVDGGRSKIIFNDCYHLDVHMNFGIIAEESILHAECVQESQALSDLKAKWEKINVSLSNLSCFQIQTNSTNSHISIYALSFTIEPVVDSYQA